MRVLREHFRPEFLNRVDDIVIFRPLGDAQLSHILDLRLNDLRKLLEDRTISLELTEAGASVDSGCGLRRGLRRASAQARAAAHGAGPARHQDSRWRSPAWRARAHRRRPQLEPTRLRTHGPRSHGVRVKRGAPSKLCLGGGGVQLSTEIRRLLSHPKRSRLRNV